MKTCTKCGGVKALSEYNRTKRTKDGRVAVCRTCTKAKYHEYKSRPEVIERRREYYLKNSEKIKEKSRAWHWENRERALAQNRKYRSTPEWQERQRELAATYYAENGNDVRRKVSEWQKLNPHACWEAKYRRRAKQYGIADTVEPFTKEDVIDRYGDQCIDCGGEWTGVDHVIPVRMGGAHSIENCEPTCLPCNQARWRKYEQEAFNLLTNIYSGEKAA